MATEEGGIDKARHNWTGRVLYDDDPREQDYIRAWEDIKDIRRILGDCRHRLQTLSVGIDRGMITTDSQTLMVSGALECAIIALYSLVNPNDQRSFLNQAKTVKALWEDVDQNPQKYVVRVGKGRDLR